ncbi:MULTISPECIES: non-heme iron oxygenase ferredoxin subunit [unclassified Polaromonas]|jgi:naphthalene 1,2-dioxygenase system ferredoxin subunit|uniref:non-heme iron oxygenase ferredoxin subunit n=1 Tax=unclassified Polaromonas TaxID=2638319 RepID=UPI000BBC7723|nr:MULTISPECIES: non-heme iron oxygenase ferredoxin subunit [unclassified Polaromonas]MDP2451655.1 non-heme iron oxygenase ferredoxin subunit [Polaromonas sp.]
MTEVFIPVLDFAEIPEGQSRRCQLEGKDVALFHVEGCIYATQDECTHGRASLADGYLIGDEVECPLHQGMFNVRTGAVTAAPCTQALRTYAVAVRDGVIHLAAEPATAN